MTPGPVERKFAKRIGFSWLEIGPQSFATGMTAEDLDQAVEAVNAAHESAIAEAVKAAVDETFDAVIEFLRTEGLDECGRMIRVQRDILFKKIAQGATHDR